jgi:hypothetical protein
LREPRECTEVSEEGERFSEDHDFTVLART